MSCGMATSPVPGATPLDPIVGLQNLMREAEAALARRVSASGESDLARPRRPAHLFRRRPGRRDDQAPIALVPSGRSFWCPEGTRRRRAYAALQARRAAARALLVVPAARAGPPIDGAMTGIVRLEVVDAGGLDEARGARRPRGCAAAALRVRRRPRPARAAEPVSRSARSSACLRHRLGDAALVRRAIEVCTAGRRMSEG